MVLRKNDRNTQRKGKKMTPQDQGRIAFSKGNLGNPYPVNTSRNRDWEYGFNNEYFKNLKRVKIIEQATNTSRGS